MNLYIYVLPSVVVVQGTAPPGEEGTLMAAVIPAGVVDLAGVVDPAGVVGLAGVVHMYHNVSLSSCSVTNLTHCFDNLSCVGSIIVDW